MLCNHCGAQNPDTVAYCQQCGRSMPATQEPQTHTSSPPLPAGAPNNSETRQRKNRGYVIAAVGAVVSLFAFYSLPFVTYHTELDPLTLTPMNSVPVTANGFDAFTQFSMLLTVITLILLALLIFTNNSFDMKNRSSILKRRRTLYVILGMSILSILIYIRVLLSNNTSFTPFDSVEYGFWIYLLGLGVVIVGSITALSKLSISLSTQAKRGEEPPSNQLPPQSNTDR